MQYDGPTMTLGILVWINAGNFFAGASSHMSPVIGIRPVAFVAMLGRPVDTTLDTERLKMEHRHTFQRDPCDEYAWQEAELQAVENLKVFAFYLQKTFAVVEFREEA
jgi:hypothetical protein